jgi:hypothetical protein
MSLKKKKGGRYFIIVLRSAALISCTVALSRFKIFKILSLNVIDPKTFLFEIQIQINKKFFKNVV